MAAQGLHSMWQQGLQGHRWGRLERPAGGTWFAMRREFDVGEEGAAAGGTLLGEPHTPAPWVLLVAQEEEAMTCSRARCIEPRRDRQRHEQYSHC